MADQTIVPFSFGEDDVTLFDVSQEVPNAKIQEEKPTVEPTSQPEKEKAIVSTDDEEDVDITDENANTNLSLLGFSQNQKTTEETKTEPEKPSEKVDYKEITNYLIEEGLWTDFEDRENIDLTGENFAELWKLQAKEAAKKELGEEKAAYGSSANELMEYLKAGGTIETFAQNYNTQKDIDSISTEDADGQEQLIREYYSAMGKDKKWIDKQVNRLKDEGEDEFKSEAEESKKELLKIINEERQAMIQEQQAIAEDNRLKAERFNSSLKKEIYSDSELADREKKEMDKFLFQAAYEDKNTGQKFSAFGVKYNEIVADPKKYYKFIKFVKDIDSFEEKSKTEKEVTKKNWNFLKGSAQTLSDAKSAEPVKADKGKKTIPAFTFKNT